MFARVSPPGAQSPEQSDIFFAVDRREAKTTVPQPKQPSPGLGSLLDWRLSDTTASVKATMRSSYAPAVLVCCLLLTLTTNIYAASKTSAQNNAEEGYLYRGNPSSRNVVEYKVGEGTNFDLQEEVDRVVEFYDPHCGHCRLFAPKYVKLANSAASSASSKLASISKSKNILPNDTQFHAVSCRQNPSVCKLFNVHSFPTLMVLPKGGTALDDAVMVSKDIMSVAVGGGVGGGYSLKGIGKAMEKAAANLDVDENDDSKGGNEREDSEDSVAAAVQERGRRLEEEDEDDTDDDFEPELQDHVMHERDEEDDYDDAVDSEEEDEGGALARGANAAAVDDDQATEDDEDEEEDEDAAADDDENSPEDADEWEANEGPPPPKPPPKLEPPALARTAGGAGAARAARAAKLALRRNPAETGTRRKPAAAAAAEDEDDEEEDSPDVDESNEEGGEDTEEEDSDERPLAAARKRAAAVSAKNKMARMKKDLESDEEEDEEDDDEPPPARKRTVNKASAAARRAALANKKKKARGATTTFGRKTAQAHAARGEEDEEDDSPDVDDSAEDASPHAKTAAALRAAKTKTTFRKIPAPAERGVESDDEDDEKDESPTKPDGRVSVRKFAAINKEESDEEDEDASEGEDDDEERDDDDEVSSVGDDDEAEVPGRPDIPGQIRPGAVPPYNAGAAGVPAGYDRAKFLAKTGMQPKDIEKYQQIAAQRRAELAKKAQKRIPPVFQGKKAAAATREAAKALKQTPEQRAQQIKDRQQKNKELLQKRIEMAKKIREQKRLANAGNAAAAGGARTSERVRSQGGPAYVLKQNTIGKKPSIPKKVLSKVPIVKRAFKTKPEEDLYGDAALSFVTGLKMGVYDDSRPLDQKRQKALIDWLELLSVSLPPELGLHALIDDLLNNINYISQGRDKLYEQLDKYPLAKKFWSDSCSKGRRGQGQNCGLWKLLHIVTVGFAEHRGGLEQQGGSAIDVPMSSGPTFTPNEGAAIIREYIALFFGCDVCKNNFLSKFDDCVSFGRCDRMPTGTTIGDIEDEDWKEFPLWLWEFHNHIAARIVQVKAKRDGGRDDEVIGIWPGTEVCFTCYNIDGSWNMEELYAFLEKTYWYASTVDFKADRALHEYERSQRSASSGKGSNFMFYLIVAAIHAFAFYAYKRRKVWMADIQKNYGSRMPIAGNGSYGSAGKKA